MTQASWIPEAETISFTMKASGTSGSHRYAFVSSAEKLACITDPLNFPTIISQWFKSTEFSFDPVKNKVDEEKGALLQINVKYSIARDSTCLCNIPFTIRCFSFFESSTDFTKTLDEVGSSLTKNFNKLANGINESTRMVTVSGGALSETDYYNLILSYLLEEHDEPNAKPELQEQYTVDKDGDKVPVSQNLPLENQTVKSFSFGK